MAMKTTDKETEKAFERLDRAYRLLRDGYRDKVIVKDEGSGHFTVKIIHAADRDDIPEKYKRKSK